MWVLGNVFEGRLVIKGSSTLNWNIVSFQYFTNAASFYRDEIMATKALQRLLRY